MGNSNSNTNSYKDDEYLNIQGNSFYENELFKIFPSCMSDDKKDQTNNDLQEDYHTNHLIDLFIKDKSISNKRLSIISALQTSENHDFKKICKARETLLMRIFNAFERYQDIRIIKMKELQNNKNSIIRTFSEKSFKNNDQSSMTMVCMSISMCLSIAKSTSNINSDIFPNLSQSIISMLKLSGIGSVSQLYESSFMVKETLDNIFEYSRDIASKTSGEIRSIALGVMLQIAIATGSLHLCVIVARDLYKGEEVLPEIDKYKINCSQTLVDLESIEFDYSIEYSKANELDNIVARLSSPKEVQKTLIFNCPSCSTIAADSTALYTWDSFSMTLYRLGNGYNSTLAGEILQINSQVESQICTYLGINIDEYRSHWFSQIKGKSTVNPDSPNQSDRQINASASWPFPRSSQNAGESDENSDSDESDNENDEDNDDSDNDNDHNDDDEDDDDDDEDVVDTEEESQDDSYQSDPSNESPDDDNEVESDSNSNSHDGSNHSSTRTPKSVESPKHDIIFPASLAICNGKLYLRMQYLLGECRLATFNCGTLELESVEEICDNTNDNTAEPYVYECMDSEPIDIRLIPNSGYLLDIIQATYHEQDVTEVLKGLISADGSYLHIDSIAQALGDPFPGMIKRVKITCNVKKKIPGTYNFDDAIGTHILSNLTSDGRKLLFIKRIEKIESTKNSLIYSGIKDIQIHSAYYQNTNNENGNVTNTIKKLWLEYLENGRDNHNVNNELFTDMQVGMTKYLWINYSIRKGELRSAAFVENTTFSFYDTIIVNMFETNSESDTLEALTIDPLKSMSVEKTKVLSIPPELTILPKVFSKVQMIFVGNKLIIQQLKYMKLTSHMIHGTVFGFSLRNGACVKKSDRRFLKKAGFPLGLCYEPTNKIIWGWDAIQVTFRQWKNNERVPHIYEPQSSDPLELIKSLSPEYRLIGLESLNHDNSINKFQAAKIMCSLDKLSEPYRPSTSEIAQAESSTYNEIVLLGEGSKNSEGRILIKIRGINCYKRAEKNLTGYFIVTLDSAFNVISYRSFPTTVPGTDRMGDYLGSLSQGCLVCLVAIFGLDIDELGSRDSANQLKSLGATKVSELKKGSVYCLIGSKGCTTGFAIEAHESGKVCSINERLPPLRIPLRVDCSFQNINILISTCHDILEDFDTNNIYSKVMLLSLLQILCGNVYHLLKGDAERDLMKEWTEEKKQSLKKVLAHVVNQPDIMGDEIFQCGLNLFLITLKLVYPTPQEKYGLLMMYLSGYNSATLDSKDSLILEPLLNQLATLDEILTLLETDDSTLARSTFNSLITLLEKELSLAISGGESKNNSLLEAAVRCMYSHVKLCLCRSAKSLDVPNPNNIELIFGISTKLISFCDKIISSLVSSGDGFVPKEVDNILRKSPVGSILPMVLSMISLVFSIKPDILQKDLNFISNLIEGLICFRTSLNRISSIIPTDTTNGSVPSTVVITQEKVYESEHPYASNMDEKTLISFPGATRVTISFDPETKTENGCDWLVFKDVETGTVYGAKYTGRNNRENWPGFGGRPELEIFASQFYMIFHSDGGIEDWGYKFTATAYISQTLTLPKHWLVSLDNQVAQTISSFVKSSLSYNYLLLDDQISVWLEDRLLIKSELFNSSIGTSDIDKLLFDLVDRPADSLAESLVSVMKKRVPEDQGNYNVISRAVYATCACILKHNYLGEEALAVAKGQSDVSDKLFKAWQCGQKMRHFFKQNVADEEALERSTNEIISKAMFLLRSQGEDKVDISVDEQLCSDSLSLLSPDVLQKTYQEKPPTQPRSPRFQKKLNDKEKDLTLSDRIIKFLQSNVKVDDLETLNKVRDIRAIFRSKGIDIIQKSLSYLESSISPFSISLLIQALTDQIRSLKRPDTSTPKIHYESATEGASLNICRLLSSNFGKYLKRLTELLKVSYNYMMDDNIKIDKRVAWKNVTLQCLTALKLDYNHSDHKELNDCNILEALQQTLSCHKFEDVVKGAEELLKVIVAGCFTGMHETPQISDFEVKVASFLEHKFIEVKDLIHYMSAFSSLYPSLSDESSMRLIHGIKNVHSESVGYYFPLSDHKEKSDFSISLLVQRNKSMVLDPIEYAPSLKVGSTVMKTAQVSNNDNAQDTNLIGKVTSIRESEIFVDWSNGKKCKYKYSQDSDDGSQEVALVDTSISGNIFIKLLSSNATENNSDNNSNNDNDNRSSFFGLRILPNGLISAFFGCDKEQIELNSTSKLSADKFSHIVLSVGEKISLYVNGNLEASESTEKILLLLLSEKAFFMDRSSFFIGQPPSYISNKGKSNTGISGLIGNMDLYHYYMNDSQVNDIFEKYCPFLEEKSKNSHFCNDIWNLGILSIIKTCCTKGSIIFKNRLMNSKEMAATAMAIYKVGGPLQKLFALKISKMVFPTLKEEDIEAMKEILLDNSNNNSITSIVQFFVNEIGRLIGYSDIRLQLQESNDIKNSIAMEIAELVVCLSEIQDDWKLRVAKEFGQCLHLAYTAVENVAHLASREMEEEKNLENDVLVPNIDLIYGTLYLLGSNSPSLMPGVDCIYTTDTAFNEPGVVLSLSKPDEEVTDIPVSRLYGEQLRVYSTTTDKVCSVPTNKVSRTGTSSTCLSSLFLQENIDISTLVHMFTAISELEITEKRKVRLPLKEFHHVTKTYESSHPYTNAIDSYTLVEFPGAESIEIKFSGQTSVENRTDFLLFYKNGLYVDHFGDKYTGRRGENNFPGIMGRKPLVINSSSFILHFHTESSTNNWGYSFTASATCLKQTITPPPLPFLYHCALNQYTKVCGLQALHNTIRCCPWLLLSLTSISKSLLSSALSPLPKLRIPRTLSPLVIESNHPYEHNLDAYFPVKIKGAKKLSVTFDKNTSTESGCDFVRLYTDYSHTTIVPSADQFSGGKNGSSSNWPGLDDRPPLTIEGDSFEIYFHTDGSLNSWGWRMIVTPIQIYDADCDVDEEYLNIDADDAYKSCCYLKELIPAFDSSSRESSSSIQETNFHFETEQPKSKHPSYDDINQYINNLMQQSVDSSVLDEDVISNLVASSSWPRGLRVQKNIQLSVRKEPSPTADIVRIIPATDNDEILAQREDGDWSYISHINGETIEGWVRRRDRDIEYLIRDSCVEGCKQDIVRIPIVLQTSDDNQKNDDSVIHLVANDTDTSISISRILKLKSSLWNKAFSAFACNASIGYSKSCLSQIFSKLPDTISSICSPSLSDVDYYPSLPDLLSLLHLELEDEEKNTSYKSAIASNLRDAFANSSQERNSKGFLLSMLQFSLNYLKSYPTSELEVPNMKALVKIVESPHPYGDNMDQIWQVRIPGAKKLRITFDEKSATETDNDFIYIVDCDDHSKKLYKHKIHGRSNGDKHWPGVGNCPSLILQGDSCAIHMITDAGVVDWGFKAIVHGILEEPSEELVAEYKSSRENRKKHMKYINIACWVLDLLHTAEDNRIQSTLYQASTVRLLQRFCTSVECEEVKVLKAVRFLSAFIQNLTSVRLENPCALFSEIESLKYNLTDIVTVSYEFNSLRSTPLEKALYELIIVISSCNYKVIRNENNLEGNYFTVKFGAPQLLTADALSQSGGNNYCEGYWVWSVKVLSFTNTAPFIGIASSNMLFGWGQGKLYFGSNDSTGVPFGPSIKANDIISIHVNFRKGEVIYYRNGAFVGLAIGPKFSNAVYEVQLGSGPFQPICYLYNENDTVDVRSNINSTINGINATLEKQIPFWLKPLDNFSKFIQLLTEGKVPPILINKYMLPSFIGYLKVTIDTDSLPKDDSIEYKISIPGAERIAIVFDESRCNDNDTIRIVSNDTTYFEQRGFAHEAVSSDLEFNINNISEFDILHHDDDVINESITVGDVVVRSRDFCYGDQDGGPGNRGVVCNIQDWKGSARNGVSVKWDGQDGVYLYRFGYRGVYDVTKLSNCDLISVNKIKLVSEPNSIIKVIESDDLSVKIETSSDDFDRKLRLIALPDFSIPSALSNSQFQRELQKLQQHFMESNTNLYLILSQYIDMVARKTSMTSDQTLDFPWQQFYSNLDEAAQNSIDEIYYQSNSVKSVNDDAISSNNDGSKSPRRSVSNGLSDSYHGPFKGFSLQGVIKDNFNQNDNIKMMIDNSHQADLTLADVKFNTLDEAVAAGKELYPACKGITMEVNGMYTLRKGTQLIKSSSSETSYILRDPTSEILLSQDDSQNIETRYSLDLESKLRYLKSIESCFKFLQILNKSFKLSFPLINLSTADDGYLLRLITANRGFLFGIIKDELFESALTENKESSDKNTFELRLSRSRVRKFARKGIPDYEGKWTIFSQAFRVIHIMPSYQLRKSARLYTTIFVGEYAQDAGGPYRESFDIYAQELQSDMLTLLIRVNNGKENIGLNREKWIPNPDSTSSLNMGMFSFLGKLMGIAIRSKEYLSLNFPSLVWKKLINESLTMDDLEAIDITKAKCIKMMREIDEKNFLYAFEDIPFVSQSASGRTVELVPNGANKLVTYENRSEYCDLLFQYHGQEFDTQINAIKSGLGEIIPLHLLSLFSHDEVETMVCGKPIIDLCILKECTEYSGCSENDDHIKLFWQAMEEFTQEERSSFIRFTWGRSRLPLNKSDFQQKLKIQSFHKSPPDYYLPVSHTCFFSIELPKYSTLEIMKSKLRYAIANCISIDGDNLIDNDNGRLAYEDDEAIN